MFATATLLLQNEFSTQAKIQFFFFIFFPFCFHSYFIQTSNQIYPAVLSINQHRTTRHLTLQWLTSELNTATDNELLYWGISRIQLDARCCFLILVDSKSWIMRFRYCVFIEVSVHDDCYCYESKLDFSCDLIWPIRIGAMILHNFTCLFWIIANFHTGHIQFHSIVFAIQFNFSHPIN